MKRFYMFFIVILFSIFLSKNLHATSNLKIISLTTGSSLGFYYHIGNRIAKLINLTSNNYKVFIYPSNGAVENIKLVATQKYDFGFTQLDTFLNYNDLNNNLKLVTILFPEVLTILVNEKINSFNDLINKKISIGNTGSGGYHNSLTILKAANIENLIKIYDFDMLESHQNFIKSNLDGFFIIVGMPAPIITNSINKVKNSKIISIPKDLKQKTLQELNGFIEFKIPKNTYKNIEAIDTIATFAVLFTHNNTSNELVKLMLNSIYSLPEFNEKITSKMQYLSKKNVIKTLNKINKIQLHQETINFFDLTNK